jgi:hypothetical protein
MTTHIGWFEEPKARGLGVGYVCIVGYWEFRHDGAGIIFILF